LAVDPFVLRYRSTRLVVRPSIPQGERLASQNHFGYSFVWRCTKLPQVAHALGTLNPGATVLRLNGAKRNVILRFPD
jgi:hypothetical protein